MNFRLSSILVVGFVLARGVPASAAARVLTEYDYNTAAFGKRQNAPPCETFDVGTDLSSPVSNLDNDRRPFTFEDKFGKLSIYLR